MSKRTCKDCRNRFSDEGTCPVRFGVTDTDDATKCDTFEPITVFDRVTQSPETIAAELVFWGHDKDGEWYTSHLLDEDYPTEAEAIAATVAKLKEPESCTDLNKQPEFTEDCFCQYCGRRIRSGILCSNCADDNNDW